jgi:2-oxoglutarate dehydrogenase E1 component
VVPELGVSVEPITRPASTTTAVGASKRHLAEQRELLDQAFA